MPSILAFLSLSKGILLQNPYEEPPLFDELEEVLEPEEIVRHEDNTLRSGKVIRRYLVKFKHYTNDDSKWMQEPHLKDVLPLLQDYKSLHKLM